MTPTQIWTTVGSELTTSNLLNAFNGFASILIAGIVVGLVIYLISRVTRRMGRGKGGL